MPSAPLDRVLIVEDNGALREAIAQTVRELGAEVLEAATSAQAIALLHEHAFDLVIADVCLPDGSAHALFEATPRIASREPLKIGISGQASAEQAFELAQLGVRAYLAKPFSLRELKEAIERVRTEPPALEPIVRASVGLLPLRAMTSRVRTAMIEEALARSGGNRSGAARLLDVTRQAVQQAIGETAKPTETAPRAPSPEGPSV
jgi:two-component system, response regulator RegA